jgi:hypothetical protein
MQHLPSDQHNRPWTLWAFGLIVILIGVYNLLLALDQALNAGDYRDLGVSYPPLLRAVLALGWGVAFGVFGAGLIWRRQWARRWILVLVSNYGAFGVLWLVVYAESDFSRDRIVFQAVITAALVGLVAWVKRWRRVRRAFETRSVSASAWFQPEHNAEKSGEAANGKRQD